MRKELELYIHIPFCVKKCAYCDFLSAPRSSEVIDAYVNAVIREIAAYDYGMCKVPTIFFGGGTPSLLSGAQIGVILRAVREAFFVEENAEITLEANPGTVSREKLEGYRRAGVNRISFGLQSANERELKLLGRIHTYDAFLESYHLARECGFANLNVDLISAIPGQTIESYEESLKKVAALQPEHISAYSLIVEVGTPFYEVYGEGKPKAGDLPSEETERLMYQRTEEILKGAGYHRYEISNYAKPGKECRHNLGYWERTDYLGIGLGASSLIGNTRFRHTRDLKEYLRCASEPEKLIREKQMLTRSEQMEEFFFLGLRKMNGVSKREFEACFHATVEEIYGAQLQKLVKQKLLIEEEDTILLTARGIDVSNYVFGELLI